MNMKHMNIKVKSWNEVPDNFTGKTEFANGNIEYSLNGFLHRLDGPALIWHDGFKAYYINGKSICNSMHKDYEHIFYNTKEYKIAKQQEDLLENMKKIKNIT